MVPAVFKKIAGFVRHGVLVRPKYGASRPRLFGAGENGGNTLDNHSAVSMADDVQEVLIQIIAIDIANIPDSRRGATSHFEEQALHCHCELPVPGLTLPLNQWFLDRDLVYVAFEEDSRKRRDEIRDRYRIVGRWERGWKRAESALR